jgi:hypothetical protein
MQYTIKVATKFFLSIPSGPYANQSQSNLTALSLFSSRVLVPLILPYTVLAGILPGILDGTAAQLVCKKPDKKEKTFLIMMAVLQEGDGGSHHLRQHQQRGDHTDQTHAPHRPQG